MSLKVVICQDTGLGKAVHAFADLYIHKAIVYEFGKLILFHDAWGN